MHQHRNKAHIGKLLVMLDTSATFGSHQVATEEPKFSKLVNIFSERINLLACKSPLASPTIK